MKKLLLGIAAIFMGFLVMATPVYAKCTQTAILGGSVCDANGNEVSDRKADGVNYFNCSCEDGDKGQGIIKILRLVIDILTGVIATLVVIGLSISGVQYLTAGGNEEQTRKAKRRIFEIVIGAAAYAVVYFLLYFLIPNFDTAGL